jgi:flavin reductase (DIM6/NTAB) family NADH-FMN oxidoreductase RutF
MLGSRTNYFSFGRQAAISGLDQYFRDERMTVHTTVVRSDEAARRQLRNALGRFATGVTIITTRCSSGRLEGLTANSFSAVSLEPPMVLWSLRKASRALRTFMESGCYAVNVLSADQSELAMRFATPADDRFDGIRFREGHGGCPLIEGALAHFECRTLQAIEGGDHIVFLGGVEASSFCDGEPLVFSAGRFRALVPETTG